MWTWIQSPPEWLRRALRTFGQAFVGTLIVLFMTGKFTVIDEATGATVPVWTSLDTLIIAAFFSGVLALLTLIQNLLEDKSGSEGFIVKK
mgnify:CR=1 FL=1